MDTDALAVCRACGHSIDAAAKLCPYCSANPVTGERIDTNALLQEIFRPKEMSTSETVLEYARHRQGVVLGVSLAIAFLLLAGLHQFVSARNDAVGADASAVPLTEVADVNATDEGKPQPMPKLDFMHEGQPRVMRTYIIERGATTPPEVVAAQQAAAAEAAAKAAAAAPKPAVPAATPAPVPVPAPAQPQPRR
ncbi:MAG TPA: hypothetical protein VF698_07675 [Thermoanaerobaculia bacterium]|jgi:hypothetical protein